MNAFEHNANAGNGVVVVSDTTATTGDFYCLQCLTETVFAALTERAATGAMTGITLPAGTMIYNGQGITAFTLTSGDVRAHKRLTY